MRGIRSSSTTISCTMVDVERNLYATRELSFIIY